MSRRTGYVFWILAVTAFAAGVALCTPAAHAQKMELSLAHSAPPSYVYQTIALKYKEIFDKKAGDKASIKIFPSAQLGQEKDTLEGAIMGTVDIALTQSSLLALWEPQMAYSEIPYILRDHDHATKVFNGPVGKSVSTKLEKHGLVVLVGLSMGTQGVFNRVKPIVTPKDIEGMKMRVIQSPLQVDLMNSWGAKAVPMNFGEVYTALQQGVIDAAQNPAWGGYHIFKFYEVAPYFSFTDHLFGITTLTMGKKKFDSLPEAIRKALVETSEEIIPLAVEMVKDVDNRLTGELVRKKVHFTVPDVEAFKKASKPCIDKWSEKTGMDLIQQVLAVK